MEKIIKEIEAKIKELESDERLSYETATVFENAPLALIQLSLKTKIDTLKWVLNIIKINQIVNSKN